MLELESTFHLQKKIHRKFDNQCKKVRWNNFGETAENIHSFKIFLGFSKTVLLKTTNFGDNLVSLIFENQGQLKRQILKHSKKVDRAKRF